MTTAISTYAKPDTVLLLDMVATDPWIDLSQHRTNLADNTTYVSEANSARTALDAPREIAIVVTVESGEEGILAQLGDAGGYSWRVRISGDVVEVAENALLRASADLPAVSKSPLAFLIHWSTHPDGVSGVRHELAVYNFDAGEWAHAQATTGAGTMDATDTLTIGAGYSGAAPFDGGIAALGKVRVGRRFHSGCEAAEDFVAETTPPAVTMVRRGAPLVPDRSTLDIADDGAFADIELDEDTHEVWKAGEPVSLSPTEFTLLRYFVINAGTVLSKPKILDHVWRYDFGGDVNVVESYVSYLRRKIDTGEKRLLHTLRGVGYVLREPR